MNGKTSYRIGVLITSPKKADKAWEMCKDRHIPTVYRISALGTAPNEMTDILGLGDPVKAIVVAPLAKEKAEEMLTAYKRQLKLGTVDSGIAFTLPINGASALLAHIMQHPVSQNQTEGKEADSMEITHSLIVVTVNQGFSREVMDAARTAGAGGGTVIHSHRTGDEQEAGKWGLSFQEDKDIVLIVATNKNKKAIMTAIGEQCGMNSEAKGLVVSLPIDSVEGLN